MGPTQASSGNISLSWFCCPLRDASSVTQREEPLVFSPRLGCPIPPIQGPQPHRYRVWGSEYPEGAGRFHGHLLPWASSPPPLCVKLPSDPTKAMKAFLTEIHRPGSCWSWKPVPFVSIYNHIRGLRQNENRSFHSSAVFVLGPCGHHPSHLRLFISFFHLKS